MKLSSPLSQIQDHYPVVVVGSGYGGAIAASRLARAGLRVCLLERGAELQPGQYPETQQEVAAQIQVDLPLGGRRGRVGPPTGLYDFRLNRDISVVVGCGLGGTSLINANVALEPDPRVWQDPRWPASLRRSPGAPPEAALAAGFVRARQMLRPTAYPAGAPDLPKLRALAAGAQAAGAVFHRPPIAVDFVGGRNHVGVLQHPCTLCGNCVSGCNFGAKNTLLTNYLPDASNHGAAIFTGVAVRRVERRGRRWLVHYQLVGAGRERFAAPDLFIAADTVILAAGTLGTTEILLRSGDAGLPLSRQLGRRFSGNGDLLGFSFDSAPLTHSVGVAAHPGEPTGEPVGPSITGLLDLRQTGGGIVIEDGVVPAALSRFFRAALGVASALSGTAAPPPVRGWLGRARRQVTLLLRGVDPRALSHTLTLLVVGHDDARGRMSLRRDRLRIAWPGVSGQAVFRRTNEVLARLTQALGGTYLRELRLRRLNRFTTLTVHPLGGCAMADRAEDGVVDHRGRVFRGQRGAAVHEGLLVLDGSIVPCSLGINPLLTICALAERGCALLLRDRGLGEPRETAAPPEREAAADPPGPPGLQYTEAMRGHLDAPASEGATRQGPAEGAPFTSILTFYVADLARLLTDAEPEIAMVGTVESPALSERPLLVTQGRCSLLARDAAATGARRIVYWMTLTSAAGRRLRFRGEKVLPPGSVAGLLDDLVTMRFEIHELHQGHEGHEEPGAQIATGTLRLQLGELLRRELPTLIATHGGLDAAVRAIGHLGLSLLSPRSARPRPVRR